MSDGPPQFDLDDVLPYLIVRVAAVLESAFTEVTAAVGLTVRQFGILAQAMSGEPLTSAEIARRLGVTPQGMGRQIDTLVARGLLERGPHPGRGRPIDVRITDTGLTTFIAAARRARAEQERTTGHLTQAEHAALLDQLREIGRRAGGPADDTGSD